MQDLHTAPRTHRVRVIGALVSIVLGGLSLATAGPANARPVVERGGQSSSAITMVPVSATDPVVNFNDQVTFTVSTTATSSPMVKLYCYQGGVEVYWSSAGFFPDYPWPWARDFTLRSSYWTGGAADCIATLYYAAGHNKFPVLATTNFHVEA